MKDNLEFLEHLTAERQILLKKIEAINTCIEMFSGSKDIKKVSRSYFRNYYRLKQRFTANDIVAELNISKKSMDYHNLITTLNYDARKGKLEILEKKWGKTVYKNSTS